MDTASLIQLIGNLGKAGTGVFSAFQKQGYPPGFTEAMQAQNDARTYLAASADPSSPYFRNLAETEELRGRNDLIAAVGEMIRQQASRNATGRGTINPERRDETVWGMLTKGFQEAGLRARETARQKLIDMAGGSSAMARGYAPVMQTGFFNDALNRQARNTGLSGAFDTAIRTGEWLGSRKPGKTAGGTAGDVATGGVKFGMSSVPDWWKDSYNAGYP